MQTNWLNSLKIAILQRDAEAIGKLTARVPTFENLESAKSAADLVLEAKEIVEAERVRLLKSLQDIKKSRAFLTQSKSNNRFDAVF